jgi:adenine-specific DNA glycosylase
MYQFPLIEKTNAEELPKIKQEIENTYSIKITDISTNIKHILSHQHLYTTFWKTDAIPEIIRKNKEYLLIQKSKLIEYPIPRVIDRYLEGN